MIAQAVPTASRGGRFAVISSMNREAAGRIKGEFRNYSNLLRARATRNLTPGCREYVAGLNAQKKNEALKIRSLIHRFTEIAANTRVSGGGGGRRTSS